MHTSPILMSSQHSASLQSQPSLALLIHGFMGHPGEFDPLIHILETQGYDTHRVCLPQHGDVPGNLSLITWEDLLTHCQEELQTCLQHYESIHLIGFSLGGALSLMLAHRNPDVFQSLTLAATPYKSVFNAEFGQYHLRYFFDRFLPGMKYWSQRDTGYPKPVMPMSKWPYLFQQMDTLFDQVQHASAKVDCPTLLIHSPYDLTVPYDHSEWLYQTLPQPHNFITLLDGGHQIFPFNAQGIVAETIVKHLSEHTSFAEPSPLRPI